MAKKKQATLTKVRGGPGSGRKPRVLPRTPPTFNTLLDEDDTGSGGPGPGVTITQAELQAYTAEEWELARRLEKYAERRRQLMSRLWDGAAVEDGLLTGGLLPVRGKTGRRFSPGDVLADIRYGDLDGPHLPWKKPVRLLVGDAARIAVVCRHRGVSKACPPGADPVPDFAVLFEPF